MLVEMMRAEYRKLRAESKMTPERFDEVARSTAVEMADGEDVRPDDWVRAALEVNYKAAKKARKSWAS